MSKEELKPCPCCGCENVIFEQYKKNGFRIACKRCALKRERRALHQSMEWLRDRMIESWNTRAPQSEWISVDSYEDIPAGTWQVAMVGRGSRLPSTGIIEANDTCSVIGSAFAFDMPRVYAYCKCAEMPKPPKGA